MCVTSERKIPWMVQDAHQELIRRSDQLWIALAHLFRIGWNNYEYVAMIKSVRGYGLSETARLIFHYKQEKKAED